jgi:hypothetical protein
MGVCPSGPGVWETMFPTDWRKASPISAEVNAALQNELVFAFAGSRIK